MVSSERGDGAVVHEVSLESAWVKKDCFPAGRGRNSCYIVQCAPTRGFLGWFDLAALLSEIIWLYNHTS